MPESRDLRDHPRRNRSPGGGQGNHGNSPRRNTSSWHPQSSERRGGDTHAYMRPRHRRDSGRDGNHRAYDPPHMGGNRHGSAANNAGGRNQPIKRGKWGKNRNKKKRRNKRNGPPLSGGNIAPVSSNRQPIASMRMRMDDYVQPRTGRLLALGRSNDIEHAVARARREASTRTKDTFWTKKLLDAESSHPNRWAHSGFKELYREELGYSEMEREKASSRRSPQRGAKRIHSPPASGKPRSPRDRYSSSRKVVKGRSDPRIRGAKSRSRSKSRSPRGRKRVRPNSPPPPGRGGGAERRPNKRSFSRSLSRSPSTITSRSDSRSYSSYSRSSSLTTTSSSSTFSSTSSGSLSLRKGRSRRRRRSYSRSIKSWSRSPSRARPPPPRKASATTTTKIKTASLSRAVQSVHSAKEKIVKPLVKPIAKTVAGDAPKGYYANPAPLTVTAGKPKIKKMRPPPEPPVAHRRHASPVSLPVVAHRTPSGDYYEKEVTHADKGSVAPFSAPVDKHAFVADPRRAPPAAEGSSGFKVPLVGPSSHHHDRVVPPPPGGPRSEGEQSPSESSSDEDELPLKMTLSERFGKLAQLSSQRQEYEGVRMKIVREGGQDKKVYLEGGSRSPSPVSRRSGGAQNPAHERWLREHKAEYDEYEERYGEFRHWDPHRDLPRELPPNWDDVNVRYRYYKESGYFGERSITMEDYLKWEEWWYRYRDWLEKYGGVQEENLSYRSNYAYEVPARTSARERWLRREGHRDKEGRKRHRY